MALRAISEETKIKESMLEALERDDVSQWPEGIFRRAYIRSYARAIGQDPEALVREFLAVHPDPIVTPAPEAETELESPQWPAGLRRAVTSARAVVPGLRRHVERGKPDAARPGEARRVEEPAPIAEVACAAVPAGDRAEAHDLPRSSDDAEPRPEIDLACVADLCTRLGRVGDWCELTPILDDAVRALDAVGLIVWSWDYHAAELRPVIALGYPQELLARMPRVPADADNAIARAHRSGEPCIVNGQEGMTGAVSVPLLAHRGSVGVLAVELRQGDEGRASVRAFAAILAAHLAALVGSEPLAAAVNA